MDVDKLFKTPMLPMGGNKRRMPNAPSPEMLKRMRPDEPASSSSFVPPDPPASNGKGKSRAVTVQDEEDVEMDTRADFAPGNDADYFTEEDDEGRFFGGGLSAEQKTILNIFDKDVGEDDSGLVTLDDRDELTITGIRRMLLRFDRAVDKNQEQRSKYSDDPSKFIDSEADLDSAIKSLLPLAQSPGLAYAELMKSGAVLKLVGLMSHENADIMIDVVQLIHELLDEDAGAGDEEDDDEERDREARETAVKALVDAFLEQSILELLVDNLPRLNESEETDRQGVFDLLGIFESMIGINPQLATHLVSKTTILSWLLKRIEAKNHDGNRGYAAELLPILLDNRPNKLALGKVDGIETLLKVASQFRKRNPVDADETEFMENVFDALCASLTEPENKKLLLDSEGVDLMVLMLKEKKDASPQCIKVLDFSMSGPAGTRCCETFVEALGLKSLFTAFMGKAGKKKSSSSSNPASAISDETGHILGVLSSLFSNLPSESAQRIRLLAKFVESEYEKVDRLMDVRESAVGRLKVVDKEIALEKKEMLAEGEEISEVDEDRWYLRRLDGGLYTLQTVDYIIAWVCMEDDGVLAHAQQMLSRKGTSIKDVVDVLKVFRANIDNSDESTPAENVEDASPPQKEILGGLIEFLEGIQ